MSASHNAQPGADLTTAYAYCRAVAKREAKNFYYGFLALPPYKRDAMCAVYAFMRRADDIADDESLSMDDRRALMSRWLHSWHAGVEVAAQDAPVFLAVHDVQTRFSVSGNLLDQLVQGTTMDLDPEPPAGVRRMTVGDRVIDQYESMQALERYCYFVASVVGMVTIRIFGFTDAHADRYAEQLGIAFQLTNILRDVKEDAERGRIYLPEELLTEHGLTSADVLAAAHSKKATAPMQALLATVAERAEALYGSADSLVPLLAPDSRAAMRVLIRIYHLLLRRIIKVRFQVFRQRVRVSTARKIMLLVGGLVRGFFGRRGSRRGANA